jgi:thioredoxin-like negative regulator of GroEL
VKEYEAGRAAYEARSCEKAERLFAKSLVYAPENVDALVMLASVQHDLCKMSEAAETLA